MNNYVLVFFLTFLVFCGKKKIKHQKLADNRENWPFCVVLDLTEPVRILLTSFVFCSPDFETSVGLPTTLNAITQYISIYTHGCKANCKIKKSVTRI